jgi:hypothetical protein
MPAASASRNRLRIPGTDRDPDRDPDRDRDRDPDRCARDDRAASALDSRG